MPHLPNYYKKRILSGYNLSCNCTMTTLQNLNSLDLALVACGTALVLYLAWPKPQILPLPPGPKALHLIGNLLDMSSGCVLEGKHWAKHKTLYGAYLLYFSIYL